MFLKETDSDHLVEVLDLRDLFDPHREAVPGRYHVGEEAGDIETFPKARLTFPSGESLPRCWRDPHYRDDELRR